MYFVHIFSKYSFNNDHEIHLLGTNEQPATSYAVIIDALRGAFGNRSSRQLTEI